MRWLSATWRWIGNLSTVAWLWSFVPAGMVGAMVGYLRALEGASFGVVLLSSIVTLTCAMILGLITTAWLQGRSQPRPAPAPPLPPPASAPTPDPSQDIRAEIEKARLERERLDALASLDFRRGLDAYVRGEPRAPEPLSGERGFDAAFDEIASDRIAFANLRLLAADYGLSLDHRDPAASNLAYEIEGALKEAAANNQLVAWGRPYNGAVRDNDPLIPIPAPHFNEYSFRHGALNHVLRNSLTSTTTMALQVQGKDGLEGVTFYDLYVSTKAAAAVIKRVADERSECDR